jgi:bacterioferritin
LSGQVLVRARNGFAAAIARNCTGLASHNDFFGTKPRHPEFRAYWQTFEEPFGMAGLDKERAIYLLNRILEEELAGVVRYTHYSFLVFGHNRIPIVSWMREQAAESLSHAQQAGEMITLLGEYPSLAIGPLLDSPQHDVDAIMRESLETEAKALSLYRELLKCAEGRSVILKEYARQMVYAEALHASEVDKMLRKPGDVAAFGPVRA